MCPRLYDLTLHFISYTPAVQYIWYQAGTLMLRIHSPRQMFNGAAGYLDFFRRNDAGLYFLIYDAKTDLLYKIVKN